MRDALYRNRFVIYILAAALLVLGIGCAIVNVNSEKLLHVYEPVLTTEYGLPREEIDIPVMVFTHVEADEKLSSLKEERLRNEREEAERQEKAERKKETQATPTGYGTDATYSPGYFRQMGVIFWGDWRWTWYSERVLPGGGLHIPGRHTDSLGYVRDGDGYICLASVDLGRGTVVATPFGGYGKVYDSGCPSGTLDVYVGW